METSNAATPAPIAAPSSRIEWIDVVKGMAISLVVYGHVLQGAAASHAIKAGRLYQFSNAFVYSFHMPAFFFVSGLLSAGALRGPPGKYIRDKAATIAWPYLVWVVFGTAAYAFFGQYYNHHDTESPLHRILTCWWDPGSAWFLHTLFCVQILMLLSVGTGVDLIMVLSLAGFFFSGWTGASVIDKILFFLPFFAVGVRAGLPLGAYLHAFRRPFRIALLLFLFQAVLVTAPFGGWLLSELILGFTGTLGLAALANAAHGFFVARILRRIGAASLGVLLLHPYVQGFTRTLLQRGFEVGGGLSAFIQIVAAIIIPVFVYERLMQGPGRFLFTLRPIRKMPRYSPAPPLATPA